MRAPILLVLVILSGSMPEAQVARTPLLVSTNTSDDARQIGIATDGSLTAICWNEGGTTNEVYVAVSHDEGLSFGVPVRVDNDALTKLTQPDGVFVSGNNIYAVWEANLTLYFSRSTDAGLSFSTPVLLDVGGTGAVREWRVGGSKDVAGDHIYVASVTNVAVLNDDLFVTVSHDDGASFAGAVLVPSVGTVGCVDNLGLCVEGLTMHIAWDDNRFGPDTVFYQKSTDGAASFPNPDTLLGNAPTVEDSNENVEVAANGSTVAVFWNEEPAGSGNEVVQVNVSTNGGAFFGGAQTIGGYAPTADDTDMGDVGVDPLTGNIVVTWEDNRTGSDETYVSVSTDGGATFGTDVQLSTAGTQNPKVLVGDSPAGTVTVFWESFVFPSASQAAVSTNGGVSWRPTITVSDNPGFVDFPAAARNSSAQNSLHAWAALDGSTLKLYAGGFGLCSGSTAATRNAGANPPSLTISGPPALASTFTASVDLSLTGHTTAALFAFDTAINVTLGGGQTLLCLDLLGNGELLAQPVKPGPTATFDIPVPPGVSFCGFTLCAQAIHFGGVFPFALSNALDMTVAAF